VFRVNQDALQRAAAEFVGTFTLIFVGAGSIIATGGGNLVAIALAHGLAIGVMASAVGHISGGHFNPVVTLGFLVARRIEPLLAAVYWAAQLLGAVAAAGLLAWLLPGAAVDATKLGVPQIAQVGAGKGMVIELILTFFLVWVIFATAADPRGTFRSIAGLAIGLTITLDIFIGGPYTGAAMNPARAFGPQLVHDAWSNGWVWYVGPALGGVLAALAYEWLYLRPLGPEPVGPRETGVQEPAPGRAATE
jgi:aquaporin TIP